MATVEADFATKTAMVTMDPGRDLTPAAVTTAFEGSNYALDGALERVGDASP